MGQPVHAGKQFSRPVEYLWCRPNRRHASYTMARPLDNLTKRAHPVRMSSWSKLLHPWWRPTLIAFNLVGVLVVIGWFMFEYSIAWVLPFTVTATLTSIVIFRELTQDALAQINEDRKKRSEPPT